MSLSSTSMASWSTQRYVRMPPGGAPAWVSNQVFGWRLTAAWTRHSLAMSSGAPLRG